MSLGLWEKLPSGFLKRGYKSWCELDYGVKQLVVELAESQKFKCALCSATRSLIIDHDHDPEEGRGDIYTIFNIRGLVCRSCNFHLRVYEAEENGEFWNWDNLSSRLSSYDYDQYIFHYRYRVSPLVEAVREKRMGSWNYWRRRTFLEKFDTWYYHGEHSEWRERWEQRQAFKVKTPEQFINVLHALVKFVSEQMDKDPDYQPPDKFIEIVAKVRPLFEQAFAMRSARRVG